MGLGRQRIVHALWLLLLVSIPLSFRYLVARFITGFHEYEAVFAYGSDLILITLIAFGFSHLIQTLRTLPRSLKLWVILFLVLGWALAFIAPIPLLALYTAARLTALIAAALIGASLMQKESVRQWSIQMVALLAVLESLWAMIQVKLQHGLGLWYLGESPLSISDPGTAKVVAEGGRVMRAAGSFLHANVLGAFLVVGLLAMLWWLSETDKKVYQFNYNRRLSLGVNAKTFFTNKFLYQKWALVVGLFAILFGLVLTFSRSSWIAAALAVIVFFIFHRPVKSTLRVAAILMVISATLWISFGWAIAPRAGFSAAEPSVSHRIIYNQIGLEMISQSPWGVGIGNQVYAAYQRNEFIPRGLTLPWQWQPIHNLYVLIGVELGLFGILSFLALLGIVLVRAFRAKSALSIALLAAVLILALFDHYFWTLEQGRLLFWLVIALSFSVSAPVVKRI